MSENKCEYQKDEYCHNNYGEWKSVVYCMKDNCSKYNPKCPACNDSEIDKTCDEACQPCPDCIKAEVISKSVIKRLAVQQTDCTTKGEEIEVLAYDRVCGMIPASRLPNTDHYVLESAYTAKCAESQKRLEMLKWDITLLERKDQQITMLREALEYYANSDNWELYDEGRSNIQFDQGEHAQEALANLKGEDNG